MPALVFQPRSFSGPLFVPPLELRTIPALSMVFEFIQVARGHLVVATNASNPKIPLLIWSLPITAVLGLQAHTTRWAFPLCRSFIPTTSSLLGFGGFGMKARKRGREPQHLSLPRVAAFHLRALARGHGQARACTDVYLLDSKRGQIRISMY